MKKLKIGIVCYPTVGGSGIVATELGISLAEKGHEIHFISSSTPFRLNKRYPNIYFHQAETNQYDVFQYPPYSLALASKIAEIARLEGLDIIHAHYALPHAVCAILAKLMVGEELKVITTLHGTDITTLGYDASLHEVIKFGIEKSDIVTAVSDSLVRETYDVIRPNQEISRVYNFIADGFATGSSGLKGELGIAANEKVVLHASNFRAVKRIDQVVRVFAQSLTRVKAKLLLVGDGPERSSIYHLVKDLGIEDQVIMLGKQENVQEIFSIADVFMLLSEKESFGLVLLEAMACGVPCIGTEVGGIPEVIINGKNGFTVPIGDTQLTSEKLVKLLSDPALHRRFANYAIQHVRCNFHAEKITSQYEALYYQALGKVEELA